LIVILFIIVGIYVGVLMWFLTGLQANSRISSVSRTNDPFVSVVIAARDEENNLELLLTSLDKQTYPQNKYEVIVANDRSTDNTEQILEAIVKHHYNFQSVRILKTPPGWAPKQWALNCAIEASKGDIILFTDADCRPTDTWICAMAAEFSDPSVGFVSAPAPLSQGHGWIDDIFLLDSLVQDGFSAGGMSRGIALSCTGRNMGIRRSVFSGVNGYDGIQSFISGDDDLLLQKVASLTDFKVSFHLRSDALVYSSPPKDIHTFFRQRFRFASKGLSYYHLNTTTEMRMILPLLYITNIIALFSMIIVIKETSLIALMLWGFKSIGDGIYSHWIFQNLKIRWPIKAFWVLTIFHPMYIAIFGALGPFLNIRWKENDKPLE